MQYSAKRSIACLTSQPTAGIVRTGKFLKMCPRPIFVEDKGRILATGAAALFFASLFSRAKRRAMLGGLTAGIPTLIVIDPQRHSSPSSISGPSGELLSARVYKWFPSMTEFGAR